MKYVFCLSILFAACASPTKDHFTVTGNITGLKDSLVYLLIPVGDSTRKDSVPVKDGKFEFTGHVETPAHAYIASKMAYFPFYIENADIHLEGNVDSSDDIRVTGSATQLAADSLKAATKEVNDLMGPLYRREDSADKKNDTALASALSARIDSLGAVRKTAILAFIKSHPQSPVSLNEIAGMTYAGNYPELEGLFEGLDTAVRGSAGGQHLAGVLTVMKRREIGEKVMDFTQSDLQGHPVQFSGYRKGRYVLLDFWASWCGPCRAENPNVLKAYNRFKTKNFVVLGVSLDDDSTKWREAVVKDGMPWTQVSDLKGWKNQVAEQYGIQGIPFNFLVDTTGTIIAKGLRGPALEKKLAEVLQ